MRIWCGGQHAERPVKPPHAHYYGDETSVTQGHRHVVELFTYPVNGDGTDGHVHRYQGTTRMSANHFHRFDGYTGPAIALPNGSHYHMISDEVDSEPFQHRGRYFKTVVEIPRHVHSFSGPTGGPLGEPPKDW
jgi:hypothetical protein